MKILVIDKFPLLRIGLSVAILDGMDNGKVEQAESLSSFLKTKADFKPDLIIQGLNMGTDEENLRIVTKVRRKYPHTGLIIFDEDPNSALLIEYLKAGVNGYVVKQSSIDDLNDCIVAVSEGNFYFNKQALVESLLNSSLAYREHAVTKKSNLTAHEYEIANYLSDGMSTSWIAEKKGRKRSTISTIKAKIYQKLQVDNIVKLKDVLSEQAFKYT
jgi:DNA-binding NarL/FixJ family response regulator